MVFVACCAPSLTQAIQEIKSTWMAYCKLPGNKAEVVCVQSAVGANKSKSILSKPALSRGIPHQRPHSVAKKVSSADAATVTSTTK